MYGNIPEHIKSLEKIQHTKSLEKIQDIKNRTREIWWSLADYDTMQKKSYKSKKIRRVAKVHDRVCEETPGKAVWNRAPCSSALRGPGTRRSRLVRDNETSRDLSGSAHRAGAHAVHPVRGWNKSRVNRGSLSRTRASAGEFF